MAVNSQTSLPQGFSIFQPTLGSQLQFFPAVGTRELDELVNAYIPGPAPAQEKRATISLDFFEYAHLTGQTFKFYPVYSMTASVESPATASPLQDSGYGSSFNASPVMSNWDWSQVNAADPSSRRQSPKTASSRQHTTDFSHLPGMKIMTKDGRDVTNSASRGSKTKEQRDHAHLMRIIKACDSCRRKKIRCDPSHKKRAAAQPASKAAKKAKAVAPEPRVAPAVAQDAFAASLAFPADQSFSATELDTLTASMSAACEPWEEFLQYPPMDDYDFFCDPEGYLSPQSSSSLSAYSTKPVTPTSQQDLLVDPYAAGLAEAAVPGANLQFNQTDSVHDYVDFNLFSPESSFSEDDRMVPIELSRQSVSQPRSPPPNPFPHAEPSGGSEGRGGGLAGGLDAQFAPGLSTPQDLLWDGEMATGGTYRDPDPGAGQDYYSPSSSALGSDVPSSNLSSLDEPRSPSYYISDLQSSSGAMSPVGGNVAISHNRIISPDVDSGTLESVSTFANASRPRRPGTYGLAQVDTIGLDETAAGRHAESMIVEASNARSTLECVRTQSPADAAQLPSRHVAVTANAETSAASGPTSTAWASVTPAVVAALLQHRGEGATASAGGDSTSARGSACRDTTQQVTASADEHWDHWSRRVSSSDQPIVDANGKNPDGVNSGSPDHDQDRRRDVLQPAVSASAAIEAAVTAAPTQPRSLTIQQTGSTVAAGDEVSRLSVLCTIAAVSSGLASPSRASCLAMMVPIVMMLAVLAAWSYMPSTRSGEVTGTCGKSTISSFGERQSWSKSSIRGMVKLQSKAITGTKPVGRMVSQSRSLITL